MRIDELNLTTPPAEVSEEVASAEARGYDGWFTAEVTGDPFIACALAATSSQRMQIGTGIAVAFSRNPMDVAYSADTLQRLSGGRFVLGLGSQIKPHITRRFSMPWGQPAARMREFVSAMRAIWASWYDGADLDFRGEFYDHTLMPPFFSPGPSEHGAPEVHLAAVGPLMTRVAGEVCDAVLAHAFTTERYLREVTIPAIREGESQAGRAEGTVAVNLGVFVISGYDEREREASEQFVRGQLAFYGSTPAYRRVLELHGWEELGQELHAMSTSGRWAEMPALIDDEVLEAFAIRGEPGELGERLGERFGGIVDRVSLYTSVELRDEDRSAMFEAVRTA